MKFKELDDKMRQYETAHDVVVLPGIWMVARLDGRGFTKLVDRLGAERPFDDTFHARMIEVTRCLMNAGQTMYGYTQSDEISILFQQRADLFNRKERKLNSVLASAASVSMSLLYGEVCHFDCRISQLPTEQSVVDYFRWRNEDAHRNGLNSWCYWTLRKEGMSAGTATSAMHGESVASKNEMLFQRGVNYNDVPEWQRRGTGFYWKSEIRQGTDPRTGETKPCVRRRLHVEEELPMKDGYSEFVRFLLERSIL